MQARVKVGTVEGEVRAPESAGIYCVRRESGKIAVARIARHIFAYPIFTALPFGAKLRLLGSSDRAKTKLGKAFEGMSHPGEQLRVMIDTISALWWTCRPFGATEFLEQRCLDYLGHFGWSALSCQLVETLYLQDRSRPGIAPSGGHRSGHREV
jgi:hypothetical protein